MDIPDLPKKYRSTIRRISSILLFIVIWHILVVSADKGIYTIPGLEFGSIPTPIETWNGFIESIGTTRTGPVVRYGIEYHILYSLRRVLIAFIFSLIVGIPIGLGIGYSKTIRDLFEPIIELSRHVPPIAWIPLTLFIISIGWFRPVFIVFIGIVFPLVLNTVYGVQNTNERFVEIAKTLGANKYQVLLKVVIPASIPSIMTGARVGLGIGWMTIVAAEMIIESRIGIGYMIWQTGEIGHYPSMIAAMIVTGIVGFSMDRGIRLLKSKIWT
ncbi:MAG: ABC-type nitrate/sulfonate/bicarbonate transport system permease component [Candidatus Methanohalarchaeum thermophilum]|uniref:ABC-type nitrate/sulfonate/bicarbonate transport system permease component n=1 Tax=Methanohalarchaeum thermophilum TaxID=1903181 RepID=A0A1Q6DWZ2_METT1|nr:MAG: ABC-type nitrate/sulfonate/bicarbonate transport system permease component [Candidatus Methanohalarchaeum thermophilum]